MSNQWSTGICSCESPQNCFYAWFCTGCAKASSKEKFDGSNWILNYLCQSNTAIRNEMRAAYDIEGSCASDIAWTICCPCCSVAQQLNEVEHRGRVKTVLMDK
eukprot:m51a1_g2034 hypothetical protein (103) ;mRNA; f:1335781-1336246